MELKEYLNIENDAYIDLTSSDGSICYHRFIQPIRYQTREDYIYHNQWTTIQEANKALCRRIKHELKSRWNAQPIALLLPTQVDNWDNWSIILFKTQEDKMEFILTWS